MCLSIDLKACGEYFAVEMAQSNARELAKDWSTYLMWLDLFLVMWLEIDDE